MTARNLFVSLKASPFPYAAIAIAHYTQKAEVNYDELGPALTLTLGGVSVTTEEDAVRVLAKTGGLGEDKVKDTAYFSLARSLATATAVPQIIASLDSLDDHLAYRTFLVGHDTTAADWIVWGVLKGSLRLLGLLKNNQHQHLLRWFNHLESLESTQAALAGLAEAKASKARLNQKTASSFALGLQNAKEGEVVTRFPPEPSGYLHIGHTKAAILNKYFAKMYNGKMIVRFDDTNPSKERSEFEETILEDLNLLNIKGDQVTHTSDYFDQIYELAITIIKIGKAYADDTEQAQMREERGQGIASKRRDATVEENLSRFEEMTKGTEGGVRWCLRAKMSVDNPNKAMRDPVIYRCNLEPHHRTGSKWKVYPTYDFACPIVDSLEGVTHALRTIEYRDRNPQYHWMIEALGLRPVSIWDFSRLNFIYTLLSKRKLRWFVDQGLVSGWDDPRFPTVRGIRRRGMTVEALTQFMLSQGPSQAIVSLEWDSIWALNKKIIDPIAPRFWSVLKTKSVPVTIQGGPTEAEIKTLPRHKKNPDIGEKKTVYTSNILIDQEDALSFEDNEEITLMDWGNAIVRSKTTDSSGAVTALTMELNLDGDFRKTKKITWLSRHTTAHPLVNATLIDYDYLITKKKLEENDDVKDFVTPVTEFREDAFTDANVRDLEQGDIIQFERRGYYIFDGVVENNAGLDGSAQKTWEFIRIPDGRAAGLASKAGGGAVDGPEQSAKTKEQAAGAIPLASTPAEVDRYYGVTPADTKMYKVDMVVGADDPNVENATKMYKIEGVYNV
ncbi:glutamate-tRNA ligase [Multifurca ochricompacta]|uniref:glutamate--tRNA ligase n=1 Tax=Multifurca ochricompacta TaxID=376703 RepID=A0AAD4MC53_9AGAM|nr:glutamate-tRNA ligase [Multifurca ochricompacta]